MDLKEQIIQEYLQQGCGYRKLQDKYGIGRTTICNFAPEPGLPKPCSGLYPLKLHHKVLLS
jgi:hypothetical protein